MAKKKKEKKKPLEKPKLPWHKEGKFLKKEKFSKQIVPKQEKLIKGWRRT